MNDLEKQIRALQRLKEKLRKSKARAKSLLAANLRKAQHAIARIAVRDGFELSSDMDTPENPLPKIRYSEIGGKPQTKKRYRNTWRSMLRRCYNSNDKAFPRYGGRGIRVCKSWRENFDAFFADMGECPKGKSSVDRKNNGAHYSCGKCAECIENRWTANCVWADSNVLKTLANLWRDIETLANGG